MSEERFSIEIKRHSLKFTACHWILYKDGETQVVEPLHGHTFHVALRMTGPLDPNGWVADFVQVEQVLQKIVDELEHKILIAKNDPQMEITEQNGQTEIKILQKKWSFPSDDVMIFPYTNMATEMIAKWVAEKLMQTLQKKNILFYPNDRYRFQLSLEEETGYFAIYENAGH